MHISDASSMLRSSFNLVVLTSHDDLSKLVMVHQTNDQTLTGHKTAEANGRPIERTILAIFHASSAFPSLFDHAVSTFGFRKLISRPPH